MIFSCKSLMTSFVFIKIHLFLVLCNSSVCFGGSLWSCSMFLSCFYVHTFTALKAILTRVCKIISLKSQRFLRNLSQRKKHLYLHLRNWNFLQQKVHVNNVLLFSFSVSVQFVIYFSFVSLLLFCIDIQECLSNSQHKTSSKII